MMTFAISTQQRRKIPEVEKYDHDHASMTHGGHVSCCGRHYSCRDHDPNIIFSMFVFF